MKAISGVTVEHGSGSLQGFELLIAIDGNFVQAAHVDIPASHLTAATVVEIAIVPVLAKESPIPMRVGSEPRGGY